MSPQAVLTFWFGPNGPKGPINDELRARWWRKDPAFDDEIRTKFSKTYQDACDQRLDDWRQSPEGWLALVIVLDQFSRNLFRDDPRAWAQDARALEHTLEALEAEIDAQLPHDGRAFLYMPLMHAEDPAMQARCVEKFQALAVEDPRAEHSLDFAIQHQRIVDRFGRFPHRNAILGRESTPEEEAFLLEPGSSF